MFECFMKFALDEAKKASDNNEVPVGCVIVRKGEIIGSAHNMMKKTLNQTEHSEIIAIRNASQKLKSGYLEECDLYVTLEPCAMCAAAISIARIRRLYCGALDEKSGGVYNNAKLFYGKKGLHHIPDHYNGLLERQCEEILKDFFIKKRNGGA